MHKEQYDVIVVGAGPAGSAASFSCAKANLRTLLIESQPLPQEKLCAGGVNPWVIQELGIPERLIERTIQQVQVVAGSKKIPTIPWPSEMAYRMAMRKDLSHFLADRASKMGVTVIDSRRVLSVLKLRDGTICGVKTSGGDINAKIVIGCDGASSTVARTSGLWEKWWGPKVLSGWLRHQAFCLETQMHMDPKIIEKRVGNTMTLFFEKEFPGYCWIFPKRRVLTVGVLSLSSSVNKEELRGQLEKLVHIHTLASELLKGGQMEPIRGAYLPIRGPLTPSYDDGLMLAGDSAAHVGAIWGEGIYFAVKAGIAAGETAVQAIHNGDVSRESLKIYEERWKMEIGENLETQSKILNDAPTPLQATIAFAEYIVKNKSKLYL
ncbi:MAG: NAD(P)/FAD-dependent oxidoreductase [Candidatus Atabeyarchaeum deiterrae]